MEGVLQLEQVAQAQQQLVRQEGIPGCGAEVEEERAVVLEAGCDDFLRKPFREEELFQMMHQHLGVRYVYQDDVPPEPAKPQTELTPSALRHLPTDILVRLKTAARHSNMLEVDQTIADIKTYDQNVAKHLAMLAEEFEYGEIVALIDTL